MGGHDAHHKAPYTIPSPDIYKVGDVPELKRVEEELAKRGLKNPWLRNDVWRYKTRQQPRFKSGFIALTRGMRIGIPAFLITIAVEKYFGIDYSHGHHGDEHH
ncbi:hypothetical protein PUN28_014060 [Cardiocondyla obscurior]|uniref:NADH dehydrogenase [ubiquinone] 1 beta subcomplex subunit 3 n=1 Tax=Cardiocondyla obscurior TaxID=286306 RepID=A0AAW2F8J3_9HYME